MIRRSITFLLFFAVFLAIGGCAQETPATFKSILQEKSKTSLPPFYKPNSENKDSAVIQNPGYEASKIP